MPEITFLNNKKNFFDDNEPTLSKDDLLRHLSGSTECFKIDFNRTMHNYQRLPYHAVVAVAPIFKEDAFDFKLLDQVIPLPERAILSQQLQKLTEVVFLQIPKPSPRYCETRWFKLFGDQKFIFAQNGYIYFGVIMGGRGYQDRVTRPDSCVRIETNKVIAQSANLIADFVCGNFIALSNNFNPFTVKLNSRENMKAFSSKLLARSSEFSALATNYESQLSDLESQMKVLQDRSNELGVEYGAKTRSLVTQKFENMQQNDEYNQEQIEVIQKRLHNAPIECWNFKRNK
ncbi:hypothetical protein OTK49_02620 [Vibrio coralliirubri]|uniref:hypothetical protein n=1 Tax=Vibrio coralliirubri TaxID=1516159 RepID=UPI0022836FB3|nr:hypothetical protein [Vibrio coralliirubri]MCY9861411.1 hypothetical protein [Vibrio coralliirubri]